MSSMLVKFEVLSAVRTAKHLPVYVLVTNCGLRKIV